ncbi:anti-sigma F factor antagonist [Clostridium oryzae]|uniref:Anti-sigma F factor antagonist n=1 Tax=Clostridium oryzae TaxID=1450648 RepID=A0A1V4IJH8_9CLOT|nr:anti-sigma F factor antagonist [Clostridium oryzae]OPJ60086.1 anti-sigma F factor antagonist [Clostridium oryzae]
MNLKFNNIEQKLVVQFIGELDHHSAEEVRIKIDDKIDREKPQCIIMDFSKVSFMDSSGIGVVIGRYKKMLLKNGHLYITNLNPTVRRVFELSGMFKIIKTFDTVDEAVSEL